MSDLGYNLRTDKGKTWKGSHLLCHARSQTKEYLLDIKIEGVAIYLERE